MEDAKVEEKKEVVLIKKGFFYYLFKLIAFPFVLIYKLILWIFKYIKIYFKMIQAILKRREKSKIIYKALARKPIDEEII